MRTIFLVLLCLCLSAPALAADPEPILIGGLFAESGPVGGVGTPSRLVGQMAVDEINAAGGLLGRPVKLVIYDTESNPNEALLAARRLNEQDKVFMVIGPTSTGSGMAVKKYTEEAGVPVIMTVGGDPVIAGGRFGPYKWTFKVPQRSSVAVKKIYGYLKDKGVEKIGLLTATDGFGKDGLGHLERLAPEFGLEVVATETMDPKGGDFSAQAFKLAMARPQAVVVWTIGPAGAITAKNFADLPGEKIMLVQCHGQPGPKFIELAGEAAEGVVMPSTKLMAASYLDDSDPQKKVLEHFIEAYTSRGLDEHYPINTHSGYAYDAVLMLKTALSRAGSLDREAFRSQMEKIDGLVGVSGVFTTSPEDHNGLSTDSLIMLEIEGGAFRPAK